jgi:hypothetical protein
MSLIFFFYFKGFGAEMGAGERGEFLAATQHGQNRQLTPRLGIMPKVGVVFPSHCSLNLVLIFLRYPHYIYLLFPILFATWKQALSMMRSGLRCLLQGPGKGYFGVTQLNHKLHNIQCT